MNKVSITSEAYDVFHDSKIKRLNPEFILATNDDNNHVLYKASRSVGMELGNEIVWMLPSTDKIVTIASLDDQFNVPDQLSHVVYAYSLSMPRKDS